MCLHGWEQTNTNSLPAPSSVNSNNCHSKHPVGLLVLRWTSNIPPSAGKALQVQTPGASLCSLATRTELESSILGLHHLEKPVECIWRCIFVFHTLQTTPRRGMRTEKHGYQHTPDKDAVQCHRATEFPCSGAEDISRTQVLTTFHGKVT